MVGCYSRARRKSGRIAEGCAKRPLRSVKIVNKGRENSAPFASIEQIQYAAGYAQCETWTLLPTSFRLFAVNSGQYSPTRHGSSSTAQEKWLLNTGGLA